ncbi:superoxide dismutase [bacterium endosymbiont of Pedicinus badii]|uniref:superoxide dismutase n=1 Tax=bacterium endosymbiont of Pedicinus badii TaxID=1719126 RepID=UPI0009BBCE57|nr:Fe-Mn family superoxide dismutase [bacterium endosymbiont of Pedicinus badii]OQM34260.1 superoxide dismutase [bacterium endosymbiont of Pedicinus badii]
MKFYLSNLPYSYNSLEPYFDEETMRIHHTKHHQSYINNLNNLLEKKKEFSNYSLIQIIKNLQNFPKEIREKVRNSSGGHLNHDLFWKILKKNTVLSGALKKEICKNFGSKEKFIKVFEEKSISHFGSGWVWLIKKDSTLFVESTKNQDNPIMGENITGVKSGTPILGIDLWEHAYYLKYRNERIKYIKAFWNVVNWDQVSLLFKESK